MKKLMVTFILALFIAGQMQAQTPDRPWSVGAGLHWADFHGLTEKSADQFKTFKFRGGPAEIFLGRYLCKAANVQLTTGLLYFRPDELNFTNQIKQDNLWFLDLDVQYKFLEKFIPENSNVVPYVYAGIGRQSFDDSQDFKAQWGLGVDLWIFGNTALSMRADYAYPFNKEIVNYWHPHIGLKYRFGCGCKDSDKDGISDAEDRCPDVYGLSNLQGCPDRDGDGIADIDDKCPDLKGVESLQGCPDKDKDGITDAEDRCPDVYGPKELKGCPDADKDGIADIDDKCPNAAGPEKYQGCPDSDGDGIIDSMDDCPTIAGPEKFKGCPDTDGDGVPDKDDKCPAVIGTVANKGCPEVSKEDQEQIIKIAKVIQFDTGKDIIKKESLVKLEELVKILNKYPALKIQVEGHTDNVGNDDANMKLSQDRVNRVKEYLISKGIAADRLKAVGYGESRPVADNATAAGKAQNRRVELKTEY